MALSWVTILLIVPMYQLYQSSFDPPVMDPRFPSTTAQGYLAI